MCLTVWRVASTSLRRRAFARRTRVSCVRSSSAARLQRKRRLTASAVVVVARGEALAPLERATAASAARSRRRCTTTSSSLCCARSAAISRLRRACELVGFDVVASGCVRLEVSVACVLQIRVLLLLSLMVVVVVSDAVLCCVSCVAVNETPRESTRAASLVA